MLAWLDDAQLKLYDVQDHCAVNCNIAATELCVQHGNLYIRAHQHVTRIGLHRLGQRLLARRAQACVEVLPHATRLFDGCAWQRMLGHTVFTLLELDDNLHHLPDLVTFSNGTVVQRNADASLALCSKQPGCNLHKIGRDARLGTYSSMHTHQGILVIWGCDRAALF